MTISLSEKELLDKMNEYAKRVGLGTELYNNQPAYVLKYAGAFTTVGGDANEAITVTGAASTDLVLINIKTAGATPRTVVSAAAATNAVNVVMSGDPSTDHVLQYFVFRAAS